MTRLENEIAQLFEDEGIVLLEFTSFGHAGRLSLRAVGDRRDSYLSVDDCVRLSRQMQHLIQEKQLLTADYRLEVSSPGLDYPLTKEWQFVKNIGRLLKVKVPGEKGPREISGRLTAVDHDGIALAVADRIIEPRYGDLLSARVLPEFNTPRMESKR